jgi:hypothetical protein
MLSRTRLEEADMAVRSWIGSNGSARGAAWWTPR